MAVTIIPIPDDAAWHETRRKHIGGSEVASLFGLGFHSYRTLWLSKHDMPDGTPDPRFTPTEETEEMEWGTEHEDTIMRVACRRYGWNEARAARQSYLSDGQGGGCTIDAVARPLDDPEYTTPFVVEVKTVGSHAFPRKWERTDDADIPPLSYQMQLAHQLDLANQAKGIKRGCIIALVGGNRLTRPFWASIDDPQVQKFIAEKNAAIRDFWASIRAHEEPPLSGDDLARRGIEGIAEGKTIDLTGNNEVTMAAADYLEWKQKEAEAEERKKEAAAILASHMGDCQIGRVGRTVIKQIINKGSPGKLVTADMVGTYIGQRAPYSYLSVKE